MHLDSAFELIRITTASVTCGMEMSTYRKVLENDLNGLQGPQRAKVRGGWPDLE